MKKTNEEIIKEAKKWLLKVYGLGYMKTKARTLRLVPYLVDRDKRIIKKAREDVLKQIENMNVSQDINDCLVLSGDAWLDIKELIKK